MFFMYPLLSYVVRSKTAYYVTEWAVQYTYPRTPVSVEVN